MNKIYGYVRCSTDENRQDIDRQIRDINKDYKVDHYFREYKSGSSLNGRDELNKLLDVIAPGDTIISTEVSRLSRNTKDFINITELVKDKQIRLILGSMILDCRDNKEIDITTKAMLNMISVFSELERDFISQRVKSGMANAKAKGKHVGRPKTSIEDIPKSFIKHHKIYKKNDLTIKELMDLSTLSRNTVKKYIKIIKEQETY